MAKVLVATEKPFAKVAVDGIKNIINEAGFEIVLLEKYTDKSELIKAVEDVDAIIFRSDIIDREVIMAAKNLKIAVRAGAGYDNIDIAASTEKNVVVMNTPGQNSNAVAELAIGMMIYQARTHFNGSAGTELRGKTLGIHAFGAVGKMVAEAAKGFGMEVYAFDPFVNASEIEKHGVKALNSVDELYSKSQYISLHIPSNEQTKKSIGFNLLSKMPKGAMLVNTARKEVINEDELITMFEQRPDFSYVSDIETANKAVLAEKFKDRFFFTPKKMGAQTQEANINAGLAAAKQIVGFITKGDKTYQVNK